MIFKEMGSVKSFKLASNDMIRFVFEKSYLDTLWRMGCGEER